MRHSPEEGTARARLSNGSVTRGWSVRSRSGVVAAATVCVDRWSIVTEPKRGPVLSPGTSSPAGEGGLERPIQLDHAPDGSLYLVDVGVIDVDSKGLTAHANTGVLWRAARTGQISVSGVDAGGGSTAGIEHLPLLVLGTSALLGADSFPWPAVDGAPQGDRGPTRERERRGGSRPPGAVGTHLPPVDSGQAAEAVGTGQWTARPRRVPAPGKVQRSLRPGSRLAMHDRGHPHLCGGCRWFAGPGAARRAMRPASRERSRFLRIPPLGRPS